MELAIHGSKNKVKVSDNAFGREFNEDLVHQVVTAYLAAGRSGTKAQKNRARVSGGGAKPWRQKGTGRARAGTIRSPLWRGGGVTFAAKPRDHSQKVNRKMYRGAMSVIFSELVRQDRLVVVDEFGVDEPKTRELVAKLADLGAPKALVVTEELDDKLALAARNLPDVGVVEAGAVDPVSLVGAEKVVITKAAVDKIQEWLA
jgi:large subunit ribosomal protein L4